MINWKYVAPRLLVAAAVLLLLWLGLNPLLRWWLVSSAQMATGAKVDIDDLQTSLLTTKVRLRGLQVANPRDTDRNLFQADEMVLDLDTAALLHRKLVVREGRVSGLEIGTRRETSGRLAPGGETTRVPGFDLPGVDWGAAGDRMSEFGARWLQYAADTLGRQAVEELETVRVSQDLLRRWPAEYGRLEARADVLRRRVEELKHVIQPPTQGNPVRNVEAFRQAADEVSAIEQELRDLRDEVNRLHEQARQDRNALVAAEQHDLQRVAQTLKLESLDPATLSDYLLGPEQGPRLAELIAWVQWARRHWPDDDEDDGPQRLRGENIVFKGVRNDPGFLVKSLVLDGRGRFGGRMLNFKGTASGLTNEPARYGKPAMLRLQTSGASQLLVEAVLDRTGDVPHDRFTLTCPQIDQPARTLGKPEQLALSVSPGKLHLMAFVELKGEYLSGQIMLRENDVQLTPALGEKFGGQRVAAQLAQSMGAIDTLEVAVDLSGTLKDPAWKLRSDLGSQLADSVSGLLQRELDARLEQLAAHVRRRAESEITQFEQLLVARQRAVLEKLQFGDNELAQLSRLVAAQMGVPERFRSGNLPLENLFRRQ